MQNTLIDVASLNKSILRLKSTGKTLDALIQTIAVNSIGHSVLHGNSEVANSLLKAMPNGSRKASLVTYIEAHSHCVYSTADKTFHHFPNPLVTGFDHEVMQALKWFDAKKEAIVSSYDVDISFQRFLKVIDNAIAKGLKVEGLEKLKVLRAAGDKFEGDKIDGELATAKLTKLTKVA